jgi:cytochrome-b5 reductase
MDSPLTDSLMYPLCGGLTRTLQQGPLTGLLADLGLQQNQVWKLE